MRAGEVSSRRDIQIIHRLMGEKGKKSSRLDCAAHLLLLVILLWYSPNSKGQQVPPIPPSVAIPPQVDPGSVPSQVLVNSVLRNRTQQLTDEVASKFSFCVVDANKDRDLAFMFPEDSQYIQDCAVGGNLLTRLCDESEIRLYFEFLKDGVAQNVNCNVTNWPTGCEPGWASSKVPTAIDLPDRIPLRDLNPQPCCTGFFCPRGLTCMLPCPLGAYCPAAVFDEITGECSPYGYRLTPGQQCGGADRWADINSASGIFCEAGQFCEQPTITEQCRKGRYCRQGSTSEEKCKLASCGAGTARQNLSVYGMLFITALATLLVLVYSCSDQVMSFRDKRKAKAREKAARLAQEHVSAMERWRVTKEMARRAKTFSGQFSKTFSRKRVKSSEEMHELSPAGHQSSDFDEISVVVAQQSPTNYAQGKLPVPPIAYVAEHGMIKRTGNNDTESQIFKYAFRQIEQEKVTKSTKETSEAILEQLPDGRKRPHIELRFEDLTMILKKSGKKILANVTGKLLPGNITAIMGPSGAGKTTFLNAVAGKATSQCRTTGHIYINGRPGSIRSYRKIIGFVPQDDIVHGSLTVEENLSFSAKYRLSVDLPKRERVLIVERIIASLGLGPIRDSLVGTVEKRGISGGQRKRVNVGLEMVMEPSLLILDEPTSGLDSTSSRLVLQSLRREAMMGVNVVVVLHQPSYGLFTMFDNVMFLAKGGRTVYLGPVVNVERYFSSLGVTVPERINPPDQYMDVLEGVVKPEGNPSFDPSLLPILWMQHEGHRIPDDLKDMAQVIEQTSGKRKIDRAKTLREEAWEEFKEPLVVWWDGIRNAVFSVPDISGRRTPGFIKQFSLILRRVSKQRFRETRLLVQDYIILFLAGICVGQLSDISDKSLGASGYSYSIIALSLLCMIAALRTFTSDKLQFWRESASGINRVAFFLAKDTVDHFNTVVKPLIYLSTFYFFNNPRSTFVSNYIVTLAFIYCVTGIAYVFGILMQPSTAQLCSVFFPVVSTLIATQRNAEGILHVLIQMTYSRWALEAYVVANAQRYYGVWLITRCGVLQRSNYDLNHYNLCVGVLIAYGLGARAVALISLYFSNRTKQK